MSTATAEPTAADLSKDAIANRYEFVLLFDVTNGNPNGDPDAGNAPRVDPETGHGLVSDVCIKRKVRNLITLAKRKEDGSPEDGYDIYVKEKAILNDQHKRGYDALGLDPKKKEGKLKEGESPKEERVRRWMCQNFFDVRMFGAVMSTGVNAGQVRGPIQFAFARSVDRIASLEQSITRMAVTTEKESAKQEGGNRTMGRKEIVPYALYEMHGYISPFLAQQTGFNEDDLELFFNALTQMFDHDRSASRGEMSACRLIVFKHDSPLGNAPARKLFSLVDIKLKDGVEVPRSFEDYTVTIDESKKPGGIEIIERL
ncbi:type I-C CRISPR-associated protein Cas7/Csd2 [Rhodopirellula sallentina]|uniref:Csd2 family CRISPR-associated protein n=1 Tax=Rhodopirellula sallentina SM41 TaxID=1263870 RepID=M5UN52_9BACT|nr:type I-C CRISPR-associated protein Cas7/Csd2 [Rhodopirellula sallentina]EMI57443.1 Csd2 family CRISPR-associated protein [Rhodopirellula sallentina SM41]